MLVSDPKIHKIEYSTQGTSDSANTAKTILITVSIVVSPVGRGTEHHAIGSGADSEVPRQCPAKRFGSADVRPVLRPLDDSGNAKPGVVAPGDQLTRSPFRRGRQQCGDFHIPRCLGEIGVSPDKGGDGDRLRLITVNTPDQHDETVL